MSESQGSGDIIRPHSRVKAGEVMENEEKDIIEKYLDDDSVGEAFNNFMMSSSGSEAKPKQKSGYDQDKVAKKMNSLTTDEKKKIIDWKQDKAIKNAKRISITGKILSSLLWAILTVASYSVYLILVSSYYIGMTLSFVLTPMPLFDYIHIENGTGTYDFAKNGRRYDKKKKFAKPYTNRNKAGIALLIVVALAKVACWIAMLYIAGIYVPIAKEHPLYVVYLCVGFIVFSVLPVYKIGAAVLTNFRKANTEHVKKVAAGNNSATKEKKITEKDITKNDVIHFFGSELKYDTPQDEINNEHVNDLMCDGDEVMDEE